MHRRLIILGNGFDLSCGLPSTYAQFFEQRYDQQLINTFNEIVSKKAFEDLFQLILVKLKDRYTIWDIFFLLHHYHEKQLQRWCDVEAYLAFVLYHDYASDYSVDLENDVRQMWTLLRQKFGSEVISELFQQLKLFERDFKSYIASESKSRKYLEARAIILGKLLHKSGYNRVVTFNYTVNNLMSGDTVFNSNTSHDFVGPGSSSNPLQKSVNIHGSIEQANIIFGVAQKGCFNKYQRVKDYGYDRIYKMILAELSNWSLDNDETEFVFYGHSLALADYPYFKQVFDHSNLSIDRKITLKFIVNLYDQDDFDNSIRFVEEGFPCDYEIKDYQFQTKRNDFIAVTDNGFRKIELAKQKITNLFKRYEKDTKNYCLLENLVSWGKIKLGITSS